MQYMPKPSMRWHSYHPRGPSSHRLMVTFPTDAKPTGPEQPASGAGCGRITESGVDRLSISSAWKYQARDDVSFGASIVTKPVLPALYEYAPVLQSGELYDKDIIGSARAGRCSFFLVSAVDIAMRLFLDTVTDRLAKGVKY